MDSKTSMGVTTKFSQKEEGAAGPRTGEQPEGGETEVTGETGEGRGRDPALLVLESRLGHHPVHQLALAQVLLGLLAVCSQLVVSLANDVHLHLSTLGEGLWAGIVFITVGCLGVFTSNRVNQFNVR